MFTTLWSYMPPLSTRTYLKTCLKMAQRARIAHPQQGTRDAPSLSRARIALAQKGTRDAPPMSRH
jgi:hypothetical protein